MKVLYQYRPIEDFSLNRMAELEHALFSHPWSRESLRAVLQGEGYYSLGAYDSDLLIGYILTQEMVDELHVLNLAIAKEHQRKGAASELLKRVLKESVSRGRRYAYLEVRDTNEPAIALYRSFGFRPITKRINYYEKSQEDALLMMTDIRSVNF